MTAARRAATITSMDARGGAPRDGRPGLRDVARHAGVSLSSASRALSEGTSASPELRERVRAAALELGYEPNLLARSLSRGATGLIGFMVREIESPGVAPVLHGAEAALRAAGYALVIATAEGRADLGADYVRLLRQRRVDGFVLVLADADDPATRTAAGAPRRALRALRQAGRVARRVVRAARPRRPRHASPARTCSRLGHRRIAFVAGTPTMRVTSEVEARAAGRRWRAAAMPSCSSRPASSRWSTATRRPSAAARRTTRRRR